MLLIAPHNQGLSGLSSRTKTVLSWIPGALEWFRMASQDTALNYQFSNEATFLSCVLKGLYSTDTMMLKRCRFSAAPEFLLALPEEHFHVLACIENGPRDESDKDSLQKLLSTYSIVPDASLVAVSNSLQIMDDDYKFPAIASIKDTAALLEVNDELGRLDPGISVKRAAYEFAQSNGIDLRSTAMAFSYALRLYTNILDTNNLSRISKVVTSQFEYLTSVWIDYVVRKLSCPQLSHNQTPEDVPMIVQKWLNSGHFIGFTDLPCALNQVVTNADLNSESVSICFDNWCTTVSAQLSRSKIGAHRLSQDGHTWHFDIEFENGCAELELAEDGCISLMSIQTHEEN